MQILSHEIRHEIQLCHDLHPSQFHSSFTFVDVPTPFPDFTWKDVQNFLENLYQDYVEKECDEEVLISERDAIIISYLALIEWHLDGSDDEKIQRLAKIIRD